MNVGAFILFVVAAVLFGVEFLALPSERVARYSFLAGGLCLLTIGFIVQFCHGGNAVNF